MDSQDLDFTKDVYSSNTLITEFRKEKSLVGKEINRYITTLTQQAMQSKSINAFKNILTNISIAITSSKADTALVKFLYDIRNELIKADIDIQVTGIFHARDLEIKEIKQRIDQYYAPIFSKIGQDNVKKFTEERLSLHKTLMESIGKLDEIEDPIEKQEAISDVTMIKNNVIIQLRKLLLAHKEE